MSRPADGLGIELISVSRFPDLDTSSLASADCFDNWILLVSYILRFIFIFQIQSRSLNIFWNFITFYLCTWILPPRRWPASFVRCFSSGCPLWENH